ncbi:MAG: thioredoxin [Thermoplasmatota archaeon]|nr:thioredoxin [Candidatus Thermoplasmatota archaeon]MBU1914015.1 thioredoxin [Candidatus Thermoplasmatota archaeon]
MSSEIEEIRKKKMAAMMQNAAASKSGGNGWPVAPVPVKDSDFEEFIKKYPKVVVDCWAPWCGPCRMLSPTIDSLARDYQGKVVYGKLNTDENSATAGKYKIMSIPTLLFFKNGQLVDKMIGAAPRAILEQNINKALG